MMPVPQLWAVCFFIMIIMLGLDTQVDARSRFSYKLLPTALINNLALRLPVCESGGTDDVSD